MAWSGLVRQGVAGMARYVQATLGMARYGTARQAWLGLACPGAAGHGTARQGNKAAVLRSRRFPQFFLADGLIKIRLDQSQSWRMLILAWPVAGARSLRSGTQKEQKKSPRHIAATTDLGFPRAGKCSVSVPPGQQAPRRLVKSRKALNAPLGMGCDPPM